MVIDPDFMRRLQASKPGGHMVRSGFRLLAVILLVTAISGFGMPTLASTEVNDAPSPAETQKVEEQDPKICKRFKPIGSHIPKKYCFRKSTWDAMREGGQQTMRAITDSGSVNTSSGEAPR